MKITCIRLFTLLALGPAAHASMPQWKAVQESPRQWQTINFTVGKEVKTLYHRVADRSPGKDGAHNLYVLPGGGRSDKITVKTLEMVKPNLPSGLFIFNLPPRRTEVTKVATLTPYNSQLSHYKLEHEVGGDKVFVVQGGNRYPASIDKHRGAYLATEGHLFKVSAPTTLANDKLSQKIKPAATKPVTTLAPAPAAHADMPQWKAVDEHISQWPVIKFQIGDKTIRLRQRLAQYDATQDKAQNLYVLTKDGPAEVPGAIPATRKSYVSALSPYQLDVSGGKGNLFVVHEGKRYPASRHFSAFAPGTTIYVKPPIAPAKADGKTKVTDGKKTVTGGKEKGAVTPGAPNAESVGPLTKKEKKLLTPNELQNYESIFKAAPDKAKDSSLQNLTVKLRDQITHEKRAEDEYRVPVDRAAYEALKPWLKKKFCAEKRNPATSVAADTRGKDFDSTEDKALPQLNSVANQSPTQGATAANASASDWAIEACKNTAASTVQTSAGGAPLYAQVPAPLPSPDGLKKDEPKKEGLDKWLTPKLVGLAAVGAVIGCVIGALAAAPVMGAIIGAAVFYGLTLFRG
jgi:hypothetical protein